MIGTRVWKAPLVTELLSWIAGMVEMERDLPRCGYATPWASQVCDVGAGGCSR